jgi:hypothetical protein
MLDNEARVRLLIDYLRELNNLYENYPSLLIDESIQNVINEIESLLITKEIESYLIKNN